VLGVRRAWRRQGLGLALLRHAFLAFRARGMTRAALDVDAANLTGAVRLYERAGMHVAKRSDTYEKAL
jgi:mycothiol synthase